MANLVRAEWLKLRKSKVLWVCCGVSAALSVLILCMSFTFSEETELTGVQGFYISMNEAQLNLFLISSVSVIFICSEFVNRTFGLSLFCGFRRRKLLCAKLVMLFAGTAIVTTVMPVIMLAVYSTVNGFGATAHEFVVMLRDYGLYLFGNFALAAFCALVALAIRNIGGAIGACIGINLALSLLPQFNAAVIQRVAKFSFMTYLTEIGGYNHGMTMFVAVVAATLVVAVIGSVILLEKAELK